MIVEVGDPIHLNLQLDDGVTSKYVRAYLKDSAGTDLAGSPFNLTHVGNGLYSNDSVVMPNTAEVTATFKVFSDSGYTTLDTDYSFGFDVFQRDDHIGLLNSISNDVAGAAEIEGEIDDSDQILDFEFENDEELEVEMGDCG